MARKNMAELAGAEMDVAGAEIGKQELERQEQIRIARRQAELALESLAKRQASQQEAQEVRRAQRVITGGGGARRSLVF